MKYGIREDSKNKERKLKNQCQNKLNLSVNVLDSLLWNEVKWRECSLLQSKDKKEIENYELEIEEEKNKIEVANGHLNEVTLKKKNLAKVCLKTNLDDDVFNELLSEIEKEDKKNKDVINMSNARINQLEDFIKSINEKQQQANIDGAIAMVNNYNDKDKQEACQRHIKSVTYFDDVLEVKNKKYTCKRIEITWNSKKPTGGIGFVVDFNDEKDKKVVEKTLELTKINYPVFDSNDETLENEKSVYYYTPFNANRIYKKLMVPSEDGNLKEVIEEYEINIEMRFKDKWKEKMKKERKEKI